MTSPVATDMDSVMTDAPNDDDSSFHVDDDSDVDSICYGALLCEARLSPQLSGQLNLFLSDATRFRQFGIVRVGEYYALSTPDSVKPSAHLNRVACTALQKLDQLPNLKVKAIIESEKLKQIRSKSKSMSAKPISISINVYGPSHLADQVGDALSEVFAHKSSLSAHKGPKRVAIRTKKMHLLNNNEDQKLSLLLPGRERVLNLVVHLCF
ncbi:hypothetical protein V8F06_013692, partial [Rhypophila decipiens]